MYALADIKYNLVTLYSSEIELDCASVKKLFLLVSKASLENATLSSLVEPVASLRMVTNLVTFGNAISVAVAVAPEIGTFTLLLTHGLELA